MTYPPIRRSKQQTSPKQLLSSSEDFSGRWLFPTEAALSAEPEKLWPGGYQNPQPSVCGQGRSENHILATVATKLQYPCGSFKPLSVIHSQIRSLNFSGYFRLLVNRWNTTQYFLLFYP
jgi:hypothetical protein